MYIQYDLTTGFINATVSGSIIAPVVTDVGQIQVDDNILIDNMKVDITQNPPNLISI